MNTSSLFRQAVLSLMTVGALASLSGCDKLHGPKPKTTAAPLPAASGPQFVQGAEVPAVTEAGVTLPAEGKRRLAAPSALASAAGTPAPELTGQALELARREVARQQAAQQAAKPQPSLPVPQGAHKGVMPGQLSRD